MLVVALTGRDNACAGHHRCRAQNWNGAQLAQSLHEEGEALRHFVRLLRSRKPIRR